MGYKLPLGTATEELADCLRSTYRAGHSAAERARARLTGEPWPLDEQLQVARAWEKREPERFVSCTRGGMAGIITGTYGCDVHSGATHVLKRVFRELRGNPAPLKVGIYTVDLDHSHSLVEGVESDCHEPDGPFLHDRDGASWDTTRR